MDEYIIILEKKNNEWLASLPEISPTFTAIGATQQEALKELKAMFKTTYEDKEKPEVPEKDIDKFTISFEIDLDVYRNIFNTSKKANKHYTAVIRDYINRQFGKKYHSLGLKLTSEYNDLLEDFAEKTSFGNKTEAVKRLIDKYRDKEQLNKKIAGK